MDIRDKQLDKHMQKRMTSARELPAAKQRLWAEKCVCIAGKQHRTTFYLMSRLWLSHLRSGSTTCNLSQISFPG
jgi:hypothetical protein